LIESYSFGRMVIDGAVYSNDLLVIGEEIKCGWWRKEGHSLQVSDIKDALDRLQPEVVIVGTGYFGMMKIPKETRSYLEERGIELVAERTEKAYGVFNGLSNSKRVLAGFHLTC